MDSSVVVALAAVVALVVWIALRETRAREVEPPPPAPPHPPRVTTPKPATPKVAAPKAATEPRSPAGDGATTAGAKKAVSSVVHDLGGGVVVRQINIDRFALAPSELHPAEDVPGRRELGYRIADELLALDDGDEDEPSPVRAIAIVAPRGLGASAVATQALSERPDDAGAVMLELGASGRAPMDPDVARSIFVHLFEMEERLSLEQVRERYLALLARPVVLHLRDASPAQVDALVPAVRGNGGAHIVVTTITSPARAGIREHTVSPLDDAVVREELTRAGAPEPSALLPLVAGHPTALRLVTHALAADPGKYLAALENASGAGLARVLAATLATIDPELAAMARALAVLPTSFDLPAAMVIGQAGDRGTTFDRLARLFDTGILAAACRDKMNRERAEVCPVLRPLLREGADDLAERGLVLEMANRLVELEDLFLAGPTKRAPALYLLGLEWPSFDLARTIARARAAEHPTFAKGAEIFDEAAPRLLAERPAMARAWGRAEA